MNEMMSYLPRQLCKLSFFSSDDPLAELSMFRDSAFGFVAKNEIASYPFLNAPARCYDIL
jgi:hypothetical protein